MIQNLCGEILQEGIVSDAVPVLITVAGRYCYVMQSQCGQLLKEGNVL